MKVAFYGGSFNPPHYGHFLATAWAIFSGEVEQVWMVPSYRHPFGKDMAPYEDRLNMCRIGVAGMEPQIYVSDCERELQTIYTIDTIEQLYVRYPQHQFRLLVGSDILQEQKQWKSFERLILIAPLLQVPRAGYTTHYIPYALPQVSSTEIRQLISLGQSIDGYTPSSIIRYILEHHLYSTSPS